jgi:hypothetical protein
MWCFGQERSGDTKPVIGRTLYEMHAIEGSSIESTTESSEQAARGHPKSELLEETLLLPEHNSRNGFENLVEAAKAPTTVISDLPIGKEPISALLTPAVSCLSDDLSCSSPILSGMASLQAEAAATKRPSLIRRISTKLMRKRASFRSMGSDTSLSAAGGSEHKRNDVFAHAQKK